MRTTIRRAAAAVAAALALGTGSAVVVASSASAAPAAPSALLPVCTAGNLAVWVNADAGSGAAGTFYYPLEFTNTSNHTCRTWGWPGVSATNINGHQLGDAAGRLSNYPPKWVNIAAAGPRTRCSPTATPRCRPPAASRPTRASSRSTPPNQRSADFGFFSLPACTVGGKHVYLRVSAIAPGTNI